MDAFYLLVSEIVNLGEASPEKQGILNCAKPSNSSKAPTPQFGSLHGWQFLPTGGSLKGKDCRRALNYQARLRSHQPSKDRGENMGTQGRAHRALSTCTQRRMEVMWRAFKWLGRRLKMPGSVSIPIQQIWTGGSRNKTISGMFLKSLKINTTIISCPNSLAGSSSYQRFLPRNLSAQKTAFVLLAQAISASTWTMNAQCLFPTGGHRLNTSLLANLSSLVPTRYLISWTPPTSAGLSHYPDELKLAVEHSVTLMSVWGPKHDGCFIILKQQSLLILYRVSSW